MRSHGARGQHFPVQQRGCGGTGRIGAAVRRKRDKAVWAQLVSLCVHTSPERAERHSRPEALSAHSLSTQSLACTLVTGRCQQVYHTLHSPQNQDTPSRQVNLECQRGRGMPASSSGPDAAMSAYPGLSGQLSSCMQSPESCTTGCSLSYCDPSRHKWDGAANAEMTHTLHRTSVSEAYWVDLEGLEVCTATGVS